LLSTAGQRGAIGAPQQRKETMKSLLFATAAACALSTSAFADETMKYRATTHIVSLQQLSPSDANGHVLGLTHLAGLISLQDGTVAQLDMDGITDYTNGVGTYTAYDVIAFSDGSALFVRENGDTTVEGQQGMFKTTYTIRGGKGRYAGATGGGSGVGHRVTSSVPTAGAELYADATLNIKTGTSDQEAEAKAMLTKAVAAVKADKEVAFGQFNRGDFNRTGLAKEQDLYPFCTRLSDGASIASASLGAPIGIDIRTLKDPNGAATGQATFDAMSKPEGVITEVHYLWPKPGTTAPLLPKTSLVTRVSADIGCGVGYFK
jgi:hypothetical protein